MKKESKKIVKKKRKKSSKSLNISNVVICGMKG